MNGKVTNFARPAETLGDASRPLTRVCPHRPRSCEPAGAEPPFLRAPRMRGRHLPVASRASLTGGPAPSRVPAEHRRPSAAPSPPGPAAPSASAADPACRPAPASRGLATLTGPRGPSASLALRCPGRRARRLRTVPRLRAASQAGPCDSTEIVPGRTAAFSPQPPTATALLASPAPPRPAPRPGSGEAGSRTHGGRGRVHRPPAGPDLMEAEPGGPAAERPAGRVPARPR